MDSFFFNSYSKGTANTDTQSDKGESPLNYYSKNSFANTNYYQQIFNEKNDISIVFEAISSLSKESLEKLGEREDNLTKSLTRLIHTINQKKIFRNAYFSLKVSDDCELNIIFQSKVYDFFRVKIYFDSEDEEDIDIFLSYQINGKNIIRQGNYQLIGKLINELENNTTL